MSETIEDFLKSRPQRLCHMCGKCCRLSTTPLSYEELKSHAEEGHAGAIDFLEIFEPYSSIEAARAVDASTVDNIINMLKVCDKYDEKALTFYRCRHILDNNLCGIYLNRKELCDRFPSYPWAVVPPGCGFEGWLFLKREERKSKVRAMKESLMDFEIMLQRATPEQIVQINLAIEKTKAIIGHYSKYGSNDW